VFLYFFDLRILITTLVSYNSSPFIRYDSLIRYLFITRKLLHQGCLVFRLMSSHSLTGAMMTINRYVLSLSQYVPLDVINNELPFPFRTFHSISNKSSKMEDVTSVAGTTNPSGAHKFTPFFNWVYL
jgi:hypothetical protein